jgi:hypothetical protein
MDPFDSEYVVDSIQYDTPDEDDRGILCDSRQSLGLEYNYVPDWRPPHAIREYHQNWFVIVNRFLIGFDHFLKQI